MLRPAYCVGRCYREWPLASENRWCVRAPPSSAVAQVMKRGSRERCIAPEQSRRGAGSGAWLALGGPPAAPGATAGTTSHAGVLMDRRDVTE
ncbi:hypothetical protein NDU88_001120 [Pleurodeles waltl]|uniref:Uncharacterized protein n=1 Tax=Pleurodeles waltl TaxID=8319 RepID=A0AAV7L8K0_PLEWA|nr:hypothetical protein NDU88_001120 [Pleurodeles waltl]